ncbi:MAG: hypothetical protein ACREVV_11450 [Steroidobacteraceae bacterium]
MSKEIVFRVMALLDRRAMLLTVLLGAASPGSAAQPRYVTELPFTFCDDGLVCVPVEVDSGRSLTFVLDTGNVISYIASDSAAELGWPLQAVTGKDGKPIDGVQHAGQRTVRLGGLSLSMRMLAFPRARMGPPNHKVAFDGAIVFTDLKDRILQIDYRHHLLRISEPLTDTGTSTLPGTLKTVTFGANGPAILTGEPFTLNGKNIQAQIDTCFTGTMLVYDAAVEKLHLSAIAGKGSPRFFPNTDGGVTMLGATTQSAGFAHVALGGRHPTIYFPSPGVHQPDGLFEATVGNELLLSSVLTLDLHHMRFDVTSAT